MAVKLKGSIMRYKSDECNIVIIGAWNTRIFSPQWVGLNLFPEENSLEVVLESGVPFLRHRSKEVLLVPRHDRIIIGVTSVSDESINRMEETACKILSLLNHTPLMATGVNFAFAEDEPPVELLALLGNNDPLSSNELAIEITKREMSRQLKTEMGVVNLKLSLQNNEVDLTLNFHYSTESSEEAQQHLRGRVLSYRDYSLRFLNATYNLAPKQELEVANASAE